MKPDGTDRRCLVDTDGPDGWPAWSPDGRWLAFVGGADGVDQLFLVRADGTGLRQVTDSSANKESLVWSPNADRIGYTASGSPGFGPFSIHLVDLDGSHDTTIATSCTGDRVRRAAGLVPRRGDHPLHRSRRRRHGLWTMTPAGEDKAFLRGESGDFGGGASIHPMAPASPSKQTSTAAAFIAAMPAHDSSCGSPRVARQDSSSAGLPTGVGSSGPGETTGPPMPR